MNQCKDCAHYHDKHAALPRLVRFFTAKSQYDHVCSSPEFADPVDGSPELCYILRINQCNGEPPLFKPKQAKQ